MTLFFWMVFLGPVLSFLLGFGLGIMWERTK
jgi:hypothetical protein